MKNRDLYVITIGFIILGLGIALLNPGESFTFFVFPFFFVGDLAPVFMISTLFILMMVFWCANKNWVDDTRFSELRDTRPVYLRVESSCQFCENPLPENAVYCPACGNSVVSRFRDNDSL